MTVNELLNSESLYVMFLLTITRLRKLTLVR